MRFEPTTRFAVARIANLDHDDFPVTTKLKAYAVIDPDRAREHLVAALVGAKGNVKQTAKDLAMSWRSVYRMIEQLNAWTEVDAALAAIGVALKQTKPRGKWRPVRPRVHVPRAKRVGRGGELALARTPGGGTDRGIARRPPSKGPAGTPRADPQERKRQAEILRRAKLQAEAEEQLRQRRGLPSGPAPTQAGGLFGPTGGGAPRPRGGLPTPLPLPAPRSSRPSPSEKAWRAERDKAMTDFAEGRIKRLPAGYAGIRYQSPKGLPKPISEAPKPSKRARARAERIAKQTEVVHVEIPVNTKQWQKPTGLRGWFETAGFSTADINDRLKNRNEPETQNIITLITAGRVYAVDENQKGVLVRVRKADVEAAKTELDDQTQRFETIFRAGQSKALSPNDFTRAYGAGTKIHSRDDAVAALAEAARDYAKKDFLWKLGRENIDPLGHGEKASSR